MRLRYLKGEKITVHWEGTPESSEFCPVGETTDEFGERLLKNPKYKGWFEQIDAAEQAPKVTFKCDVCGEEAKSKAGLGSHKRKHKEKVT